MCWNKLSSQGGRALDSTSPLLDTKSSYRSALTFIVYDDGAYMRHMNACKILSVSGVIPNVANVSIASSFFEVVSAALLFLGLRKHSRYHTPYMHENQ